jgi:hypothetical protein
LRDKRKRAADLADDMEAASELLQRSSVKVTEAHDRTRATKLAAVRWGAKDEVTTRIL